MSTSTRDADRKRGATRLVWLGVLLTGMVVWLGLVTPFDHPERTRVDNALLLLGGLGLVNTLLLVRTRLFSPGGGARIGLAAYALLSAAALGAADFGDWRTVGWIVKTLGLVILFFTLKGLAARDG